MRIALLVPGGMDPGGFESLPYLQDLVAELARIHDVEVFALRPRPRPPRFELGGVPVHNVGGLRGGRALGTVLARHAARRFDVLHAFWATAPGAVAAAAARLLRRPLVLHVAGGELVGLPAVGYGGRLSARGRALARASLGAADRITVASPAMQELVGERGLAADLVPLGVSLERWPAAPPRARGEGPLRLLHVGSLSGVKDQTTLVEAARLLAAAGLDYRLDLVGTDTLEGRVQASARAAGLPEDRVRFHGFLPQPSLRPLMKAAHLLVISSRHEAGPVALVEAAVAGVPAAGTAVGHVREWAPDAALAVPVADPSALAAAVAGLARDEELRLELARAAHARAVARDARWTAARFSCIYDELA